ncbi:MAG: hypothetical protein KGI79_00240 [Patescibacteria group bacterium]|nr:hypothetical protein [Patescibacteria group bacterium]MDE2116300.1 hypothetical protein [Patescibacteria group bacterium]
MKKLHAMRYGAWGAAVALAVAVALPASAHQVIAQTSVSVGGSTGLYGSAGISATGSGSAESGSTATGSASLDANANVGADVNAVTPATNSSSAAASGSASVPAANVTGATYNTLNGGAASGTTASSSAYTFVLTRDAVNASSTTSYMAPTRVTSSSDFGAYARALMVSDSNIAKIASNDGEVSVWYDEPAEVLGFIPATATVQANVDASGNVTVNYPWWYMIFVKNSNQAQFQSDLSNTAGTIARGEATTTLSSMTKARLVNALQSIMKTYHDMTIPATASSSASSTVGY